jgi:alpha-glucosidase
MLLITLPGTAILYVGDEIEIGTVAIPPGRVRDPFERRLPGYGLNRDPARTTMRWDASEPAGADDLEWCNIATQNADPQSLLVLYRRLIALRKRSSDLFAAARASERVLSHWRRNDAGAVFVALDPGEAEETAPFEGEGRVLVSTRLDRQGQCLQAVSFCGRTRGVVLEAGGRLFRNA